MSTAIADVKNGMGVRKAAKKYSVPRSTLSDRISGRIQEGAHWGKKALFSIEDEKEMIKCAVQRADMGIGFSKSNFLRFAGSMANTRNISLRWAKPSDMWWRWLKRRHEGFSLRTPEATATVRHDAMSRDRMRLFFSELGKVVQTSNFKNNPGRIWNMDETGVSLSHKPSKVLAKKGAKAIHGKASTSRELVTVIACSNADGGYIPPHFVIPGKTVRKLEGYNIQSIREKESSLKGANFSVSDSGGTKDGIAKLWFTETFLKNIGPARPQLLICDGHGSHNNVEFVELSKQNDIILVELPSHTSNWTQPLDRTVFKLMKSHWNTALDDFVKSTGVAVGHKQFLRLFDIAWQAAMTPKTIWNGFVATGIYPFNPDAIPDEAYAPHKGCVQTQSEESCDNIT
ncbi:uncharacterized protein LOC110456536, partial [Mizuhopecten yessoensis]|uniref:uncharacterized protein LOC110456536 n=1 Tax=Mizuhopecten yessoensis TaxID=6573 RepID=UPI000B45829B